MSTPALTRFAPLLFVGLWSTGFIGARYGMPHAEPATFLALRFTGVLLIMFPVVLWLRVPFPRRETVGHLAVAGLLIQGGYLLGVFGLALMVTLWRAYLALGDTLGGSVDEVSQHIARIGHIQVADNPGRNEPGTGEIHYHFLFAQLDRIGYKGFVGCEYKPKNGTEAGLVWLEHARRQLRPVR